MAKQLEGIIVCAKVLEVTENDWHDPVSGQTKVFRSIRVLMPHGDGTISKENISIPPKMTPPTLEIGNVYALPCTVYLNKKKVVLNWTLRTDMAPFPAPELG